MIVDSIYPNENVYKSILFTKDNCLNAINLIQYYYNTFNKHRLIFIEAYNGFSIYPRCNPRECIESLEYNEYFVFNDNFGFRESIAEKYYKNKYSKIKNISENTVIKEEQLIRKPIIIYRNELRIENFIKDLLKKDCIKFKDYLTLSIENGDLNKITKIKYDNTDLEVYEPNSKLEFKNNKNEKSFLHVRDLTDEKQKELLEILDKKRMIDKYGFKEDYFLNRKTKDWIKTCTFGELERDLDNEFSNTW